MSVSARFPNSSVEFELLCLIARPKPDLPQAVQLLRAGINFPALIDLAEDHGVRPQLIGSLSALSWPHVPPPVRAELEGFQRLHGARALAAAEELCRVAAALAEKKLRFAVFKGAVLAVALYGDVSRREYVDIDILVPAEQVDAAERLLEALGYRAANGDRAFRHAFLAYLRQWAFVHAAADTAIDLHWDFSGAHVPFPLSPADVWRDLDPVSIGNHSLPTVSGANLALLLAGHGTKEAWRCLGWVCDFAMLLDRSPDLDWLDIHSRAQARGCGDAVLLACAVARELLDATVPQALLGPLDRNDRVGALAARLTRHLREGLPEPDSEQNFSDFHLCESRLAKLGAWLRLAMTRTAGDYEAMKLPPALWSLYYVMRPFRLAAKVVASISLPSTSMKR